MARLAPFAFLLVSLLGSAHAQPVPPDADRLVGRWLAGQQGATRGGATLSFTERADRHFEGLRGDRRIQTETAVTLAPEGQRRQLLEVRVDGQSVSPERAREIEQRLERAHGPELALTRRVPLLTPNLLAGARPTRPAEQVERDGRMLWRVDAELGASKADFDRALLYFQVDGAEVRLVEAEVEILVAPPPRRRNRRDRRPPPPSARVQISAEFERDASGLDLPSVQRVEAMLRQRRRLRTFSVIVRSDLLLSDYRVELAR